MNEINLKRSILIGFMLMAAFKFAQAKTILSFSGLVESSETVVMTDGKVTEPGTLATLLSPYTIKYGSPMTIDAVGWRLSAKDKSFEIDGFTKGDVVTVTLAKNRLTTNAENTTNLGTYKFVAQAGKESVPVTLTDTKLGLYTKDGEVCITAIEIMTAEEAAELETVSRPIISCIEGQVTIVPGVSNKGNEVITYYTVDGTTPSVANGTAGTSLTVDAATVVKAVSITAGAESEVASAICSLTEPRAESIDLTALNAGEDVRLASTGIGSNGFYYADEYLERLYGTLAFASPSNWTIGASGLKSKGINDYFEIPCLKEGDKVTISVTSGRIQLYGQPTDNHLVNGKIPADGYANIAKADDYSYVVTMLVDANLKMASKDDAVTITGITVDEKEDENYEMPDTRTPAPQNRALWACQTAGGDKTFVSWRARKTDTDATSYVLYRNGDVYDVFTDKTNVTIAGTAGSYTNDTYTLVVCNAGVPIAQETMTIPAGSVKAKSWMRIALADEPTVTNTGVMWNKEGVDDGYLVRYYPNDMSCYDMDGDGQEELIVKWEPSNAQDNGYSGYTANVYIDCYKMDYSTAEPTASMMWRINMGQNIRAGAHYTMFLCYDFDGDGKGEMIAKTSLGTKDGQGNYVFQSRIDERGLDVTRDYTRQDDGGTPQKSHGHIGVGEEWLTVFNGTTGAEMATVDFDPKFNAVADWHEPANSSNKYNKGTRFKACVAFLDGRNPSAVFNRGYYSQSFFTAYNWNGTHLYKVWRHASKTKGEGLYAQGNHSLVVADVDGDGFDEIGTGPAVLDHDGTVLWSSGFGHGDALHIGDFFPDNEGLEIFYVNEEYGESPYSTALFDAKTGRLLQGHAQMGMDTGRGLAADFSSAHRGAELVTKGDKDSQGNTYLVQYLDDTPDWIGGAGDYAWRNGSLVKGFEATDEEGQTVINDVTSYPNFRIYWDGDLFDEWMDSRHVDKFNDKTETWERLYSFDTPSHKARSINGTKENPNLQTDLFGDWREEVIFYDYDVTSTTQKTVTSKSINDGAEFTVSWENRQYYLLIFGSTVPTDHRVPWLRDDHVYDMSIAWQNIGYNQPPHLSYSPVEVYGKDDETDGITDAAVTAMTDDTCFTLQGIRVENPRKGIYLKSNRKIVIK